VLSLVSEAEDRVKFVHVPAKIAEKEQKDSKFPEVIALNAAEINPDKFGRFTPGSNIPIISADESKAMNLDYYLVLPWHFREGIIRKEKDYLFSGGNLIFPLPEIEVI
jgi:hypothetical protein|tara:strand:- start:145 stop:468 length:324 start_codon:yes stop_codon:yes gene_type:complete